MTKQRQFAIVIKLVSSMMTVGCMAPQPNSVLAENDPQSAQILSPEAVQRYREIMPKVAWPKLQYIIESPDTIWYDKGIMKPVYQDTVGGITTSGRLAPVGGRLNSQASRIIEPNGRSFFSRDGQDWAFPLGHTAGTDDSPNIETINFLHLPPKSSGGVWAIAFWEALGSGDITEWRWLFPIGAIIGEVLLITNNNDKVVFEIRTRERFETSWATNAFRPFTSFEHLASVMRANPPNWDEGKLKTFLTQLTSYGNLKSEQRDGGVMRKVFSATGYVDQLPVFNDPDYVKKLLRTQVFSSVYQRPWKGAAHAPTASEQFSLVPQNYFAGIFEVSEPSCIRCHQNANEPIENYVKSSMLYGNLWGMDGIFSFHILDDSRYPTLINGNDNRRIRPQFIKSGIVKPQLPDQLPEAVYRRMDVPYREVTNRVRIPKEY